MFKLVQVIDVNVVGCDQREDLELEFDTREEAEKYLINHPELQDEASEAALNYFEPCGYIEIEETEDEYEEIEEYENE